MARLQVLEARIYTESQCGFLAGRSTIDMVFPIRQLQEKCHEQNKVLYLAFIDPTEAFDLVSRSGLFKILKKVECPPKTLCHYPILPRGYPEHRVLQWSNVRAIPDRQSHAVHGNDDGVYIQTRSDWRLFLTRLRAKTKAQAVTIREAPLANDAALATHTEPVLQRPWIA